MRWLDGGWRLKIDLRQGGAESKAGCGVEIKISFSRINFMFHLSITNINNYTYTQLALVSVFNL